MREDDEMACLIADFFSYMSNLGNGTLKIVHVVCY